jgi:hypothetical protein
MKTGFRIQDSGFRGTAWTVLALGLVALATAIGLAGQRLSDGTALSESAAATAGFHRGMVDGRVLPPNAVHIVARHKDGTIFYDQVSHNLRVNAGVNWQYNQMAGTTAAVCTYMALSNDSGAPAAGDTALASEITSNNLARANATPAHSSNATSYTLTYTWTANGNQSVQKEGVLNAATSGTLCFEDSFSQVNMNSGDTLQVVHTLNF